MANGVMTNPARHCLLIMAGGTGGHVMPGSAVAEVLRQRGWEIVWMGAPGGMETRLVPQRQIPMTLVPFGGVRGKGWQTKLQLPLNLLRACWFDAQAVRQVRPTVVLGMGGYIAFPGGLMARLLGKPLVLHEQNSIAGLTNKLLAKIASRVLTAFPNVLPSAEWTGNPILGAIAHIASPEVRFAMRQGPLRLLVVGGSLGAAALNELVPQALALLPLEQRPQVLHQSGEKHLAALRHNYEQAGVQADLVPFIDDMAQAYAQADLLICRAGAMTVAEIAAVGVASIFVPFPHAVDDHQTTNARFLAEQGAAWLWPQTQLSATQLADLLRGVKRDELLAMALKARSLGKPDAAEQVANVCASFAPATT